MAPLQPSFWILARPNRNVRSNKLGEYLACSLGVIHTGNPGLRFLEDEGVARSFDPDDPDSLKRLVAELALAPDEVGRMRARSRDYFEHEYCLEKQAEPFFAWLKDAAATK